MMFGYCVPEPHGGIYLLITAIGKMYIVVSAAGEIKGNGNDCLNY